MKPTWDAACFVHCPGYYPAFIFLFYIFSCIYRKNAVPLQFEMRRALSFILPVLCVLPLLAHAEHVFEAGIHGGVASWSGQTAYVASQVGWQGGAHVYYLYLSPAVVGLRTGVTIDRHSAGFGRMNYEDSYSTTDVDGQQMDISYSIGRLNEQHTQWSVGVPIQLALTYYGFTLYAGGKAAFPFSGLFRQKAEHTALSVYFPAYDNMVEESIPLGASRDFSMLNEGKITLPQVQWWLSFELNYAIPLNRWATRYRSYLMIGAYADYCLTAYQPAQSSTESLLMLTDTRNGFPLQHVLTPVVESNRQGVKLVNEGRLFDVGIKLSYAIAPYDPHSDTKKKCHCALY